MSLNAERPLEESSVIRSYHERIPSLMMMALAMMATIRIKIPTTYNLNMLKYIKSNTFGIE